MPAAHLTLREEDVVRLTLEFLQNRQLHISQLSVERETGVINGEYSDDVVFLRQLVLDGQWDDVLEFIQPLEALPSFDMRRFKYAVLRHKYVELLCIKNEAGLHGAMGAACGMDSAVDEVVKVMKELEKYAPSKDEYSQLCLLLTLPRLTDHLQYRDWNPSNARVQCFQEVFPLVEKFLPGEKKPPDVNSPSKCARNDRLVQLLIKGVLYESCVAYCQGKATGSPEQRSQEMNFGRLLDGSAGFSDSDLSLLSWLQSIPPDTFAVPFEQRTLNVDVERLERPSLETSWTEHMLVTPIKPKMFPHSAMPLSRPRSAADMMTRSLLPAGLGGLAGLGLGRVSSALMTLSTGDIGLGGALGARDAMSRSSFASFHLTGHKNNKLMNTSVDRLFETDGDVFLSSSYGDLFPPGLPAIQEMQHAATATSTSTPHKQTAAEAGGGGGKAAAAGSKQPSTVNSSATSTPEHRGRESPANSRSSRRDSLTDRPLSMPPPAVPPPAAPAPAPGHLGPHHGGGHPQQHQQHARAASPGAASASETSYDSGNNLLQEYQRQKMRYQQEATRDNRLAEER
ncbi:WD repeat-containing protein 47 [Frankliniella fusca]|uniref:WD repeat-containing protein 47 n=1 Tax=Frankliniella fusca TaxID=407009 RepID=A0AAE1H3H4_9NEOP|nr:WD repeat-containing protein 47 [Frankliniella fusca]